MSEKKVWAVYILYEDWYPVRWAPYFDSEAEAKAWIARDHDWEGRVETWEIEVSVEDEE